MIIEKFLNKWILFLLLIIPLCGLVFEEPYYITLTTKVIILAIAGIGLNLALGYCGLISFGHAAFFGTGGYVTGILSFHALNDELLFSWPIEFFGTSEMLIIWPIAILVCAALSFIIGILSLRTSGVYFIMITLAFAQMLYFFSISWPTYGGEDGLSIYLRNSFPMVNTMDPFTFYLICLVWLVIALFVSFKLINSAFGMAFQAIKENEERVKSVGIETLKVKLIVFVISGTIAGLAGSLYTDLNRFVSPSVLDWHTSGEIMIFVILGGMARLYGPIVGAAFFIILEQTLGAYTENWQFWLGLILILEILYVRSGILGLFDKKKIMNNKILNIKNLSKSYGAFKVTDEIAIDLNFNEIHALIGPNGAGKSTLIKQIVGSVRHDIGSIILDQENITDLSDVERAKIGISRTFQVSSIIPSFSALENIILSLLNGSNKTFQFFKNIKNNKDLDFKAKNILKEIELIDKSEIVASQLSHGDRRKLEVGLALATNPKVFLFDEPMAGLDENGTKIMINLFKKIKLNTPILLIEHDMDAVFALADRVSVINYGRIVATGTVDQIKSNELVRDVYLGYEI